MRRFRKCNRQFLGSLIKSGIRNRFYIGVYFLILCILFFPIKIYIFSQEKEPLTPLRAGTIIGIGGYSPKGFFEEIQSMKTLLEKELNIKLYLKFYPDAQTLKNDIKEEKLDFAICEIMTYLKLHKDIGVMPFIGLSIDGKKTSYFHIFVHKDSGIKKIEDLRGKRFVYFMEKDWSKTYQFMQALLREKGLDSPESFFSSCTKVTSEVSAILAVIYGRADVVLETEIILKGLRFKKNLVSIYKFDYPIPHILSFYRKISDPKLIERIERAKKTVPNLTQQEVVENIPQQLPIKLKLINIQDKDYDNFRQVLKELDIKY